MRYPKVFLAAAIAVGALTAATSAHAVVITFATFTTDTRDSNALWTNSGTGGSLVSTTNSASTGASVSSVVFSFANTPSLASLTNLPAAFELNATAGVGNPATLNSGVLIQGGLGGSFSFVTTQAYVVGSTVFAAGSNLLSGNFTGGSILGPDNGTTGGFFASNVTFLSDFLDLSTLSAGDFGIQLGNVTPSLTAAPGNALDDFRARTSGSFSGDGFVAAVPEPESWALMIIGFGIIGSGLRRRRQSAAVTFGRGRLTAI